MRRSTTYPSVRFSRTTSVKDLVFLKELVEAGKIESVIDRVYALEQTAEAHRYIDTGDKRGHVVITLDHGDRP
jgi:NADPH:quinone reductase-like Zn-dependent oxidoreductase